MAASFRIVLCGCTKKQLIPALWKASEFFKKFMRKRVFDLVGWESGLRPRQTQWEKEKAYWDLRHRK